MGDIDRRLRTFKGEEVVIIQKIKCPRHKCGRRVCDIGVTRFRIVIELKCPHCNEIVRVYWKLMEKKCFMSDRKITVKSGNEEFTLREQIRLKRILTEKYIQNNEFQNLLFVTKLNTSICSVVLNEAIRQIVNEINLQRDEIELFPSFSVHTFRHTFATRCIEAGILPKTVQGYLGHATLQMTMDLYVYVTEEFKQKELEKLNSVPHKH